MRRDSAAVSAACGTGSAGRSLEWPAASDGGSGEGSRSWPCSLRSPWSGRLGSAIASRVSKKVHEVT